MYIFLYFLFTPIQYLTQLTKSMLQKNSLHQSINNSIQNKGQSTTFTFKLAMSLAKMKKTHNKIRLKTDIQNQDDINHSPVSKIKRMAGIPFSTKNSNPNNNINISDSHGCTKNIFFRNDEEKKKKKQKKIEQQNDKIIFCQDFSQKPSKKNSFKDQIIEKINESQYFKKPKNKHMYFSNFHNNHFTTSIDKIYRNTNFSPFVVKQQKNVDSATRINKSKSKINHKKKDSSEKQTSQPKFNQKKFQAYTISNKLKPARRYSLTDSNTRNLQKQLHKLKSKLKTQLNPSNQKQDNTLHKLNQSKNIDNLRNHNSKMFPQKFNLLQAIMTNKQVLTIYSQILNNYQLLQISNYQHIYYLYKQGSSFKNGHNNNKFDDKKGHYISTPHQHIAYRYQLLQLLGKGSFGQVFKAFDHKLKQLIAMKIIRNRKTPNSQAKIQYSILEYIKQMDQQNCVNVVHVKETFVFRNHFFMTFQLLSYNLYELIKINKFLPLSSELIRRISIQILSTLLFLYKHNIIHCDIKPQNILLKSSEKSGIKLIDFGSSCFTDQKLYTYIQSRYYRAPQVILGYDYSTQIDMWSFACVAAELKLSYPIFSGQDQQQQIALITQVIGIPEKSFYRETQRGDYYFNSESILKDRQGNKIQAQSRPLDRLFSDIDFIDFLTRIFVWDPKKRMTPVQALQHKWILKGLPNEIKQQHLQFLQQQRKLINDMLNKRKGLNKSDSKTFSQQLVQKAIKCMTQQNE